jgi:hypothetical protein|nr:MAG TPA: hypothetical protein [Caudoviricetes sp.]
MVTEMVTLTFAEMQSFINYVVDNTLIYGMGYKDVLIQYCTAKFYGKIEFESDDIAEIYDNEYEKLYYSDYAVNKGQFAIIENAINEELDRRIKLLSASMVMSDANDAIASLATKLSNFVDALGKANKNINIDSDKVNAMVDTMGKIKDNVTADNLVKAMVDNGIIKGKKKTTRKPKSVTEVAEKEATAKNITVSKGGK